jgi:hypothetical protein
VKTYDFTKWLLEHTIKFPKSQRFVTELTMYKRKRLYKFFLLSALLLLMFTPAKAEMLKNITAEGSCAIVGMSAEESQLIALQKARAAAIEQAAGVSVVSSTLVTNMMLRADFIKTYSKGLIISEKAEWLPLGQYQKDSSTPPIPEYRVRLLAEVYVPAVKVKPIGLQAKVNSAVFKNGERANIEVKTERDVKIGIFNITADDKVVMLFPNDYEKDNFISKNKMLVFPQKSSKIELIMQTLAGHRRDAEAFYVISLDEGLKRNFGDLFVSGQPMGFSMFFKKYSEVADYCEDAILTYEVVETKD